MHGRILSAGLLAGACVVSVLAVADALANKTASAIDLTVEYQYPHVTVEISHPTHLLAVLEELCQQTYANCELGPELAEVLLEPMTVQGTWFEVVRKLFEGTQFDLEGTQFDLAAIAPSPQQAGHLLVKRRMPAKAVEQQPAVLGGNGADQASGEVQSEKRGGGSVLSTPAGDGPRGTNQGAQTQESAIPEGAIALSRGQQDVVVRKGGGDSQRRGDSVASSSTSQATPPPVAAESSEDQIRTSLEAIHDLYVGPPTGSFASPPPGMAVLPFPDENGNPILVRITNEPITMLPFPDSQGRPIPVPPGVPGLKLLNPFPSTPAGPK